MNIIKNLLTLSAFLFLFAAISESAKADWTDVDLTEPLVGCAVMGVGNYTVNNDTQAATMGCLVGGIATYILNSRSENKVADKYENRIKTLETQLDDILTNQAINNSQGIGDHGIIIKKEVIPGKKLPDGSIQLPTVRLKPDLPGKDVVIGD